jgi:FKBP-type peptidyl-prolyl cis-trans isomerase (trigger factor)
MIQKNIVKQPKSVVEVQVAVPWTDLQGAWDANLAKMAQDVEIPGFRKGSAPANMI